MRGGLIQLIIKTIIRQARIEGFAGLLDIGIDNKGMICKIAPHLVAPGARVIRASGALASPPFVDPHTHLDKALFQPAPNKGGTLEEAIEIMQSCKAGLYQDDDSFTKRVNRLLECALRKGTAAIRTHVDVDSVSGTKGIKRMLQIKEDWKDRISLQIVAFPQDGLVRQPGVLADLILALEAGADAIGGIPGVEKSKQDAEEHTRLIFDLAARFDLDVDMHIDESDDPLSRNLEYLAEYTIRSGWEGRVAAAHCCALSAYEDDYAARVISKVLRAGITVITNPTVNLVLQGRHDRQPQRRGITRVKELIAAGVDVTCGQDNIRDVFYPFGQGDMLEVGFVLALAAQLTGKDEIEIISHMIRSKAAGLLRLPGYGIDVGKPANLVLLRVESFADALASRPGCMLVMREGRVLYLNG